MIPHHSTVSHLDTRRARSQADRSKSTKLASFEYLRLKSENTKLYQTGIFWKYQNVTFTGQLKINIKMRISKVSKIAKIVNLLWVLRNGKVICLRFKSLHSSSFSKYKKLLVFLKKMQLNFKPYSLLGANFVFWGWTSVSL